jgi:lipoprotein-anchoring transpeptidase ErfK/SrfK
MVTRSASDTFRRPALFVVAALLAVCAPAFFAEVARAAEPTQLSVTVKPRAVVYHGSAVISGTISVPNAVLSVLARRPSEPDFSEYSPRPSITAGPDGAFSFSVSPSVNTDYRLVFAGDDAHDAAATDVSLRVRPRVTTSFPVSLWLGGSVVLRGAVAPAHPGAIVSIERRVDGVWQPLTTATLGSDSRFALSWTPETFGFFRLRARLDADTEHDAGLSTSEQVIVNRPNAHRVPYKYAHYIVIVRHEYRLYYYEHGALVRRFDVALGRPGYPTPLGYFRIYHKRKPAGGALGACAMFYRHLRGIAIHGTNEPWLLRRPIPRAFSHGCARMYNSQVLWLYARVPVGTYVHNLR